MTAPVATRLVPALWLLSFIALAILAVWRLDIFPLATTLDVAGNPSAVRAFFTVDHPFHTARASLLRDAWASFDTVRWVGNHQGGYPTEFYPFGTQAIAAIVSIGTFGAVGVTSAWALTIAILLLLPGVAYVLIGRVDRLTPGVALVALAGQIAIASDWTHGGFTELVEWGLATNVAGFTWALVALPLMVMAVERGSPRYAALAAGAVAICAVTNPRALLAVGVVGVAVLADAALRRDLRRSLVGVGLVATLSIGLAAPVLVPLARYRDFYFFLSYQEYADLGAYWSATVGSVSWPVAALAVAGIALALVRGRRAARVAALALTIYVTMTAMLIVVPSLGNAIPQLELPRLMPFQRLLVIWAAAYGTIELARLVARVPARAATLHDAAVAVLAAVAVVLVFATSLGPFPVTEQGLRPVPRSEGANGVELMQFEDAIAAADVAAQPGTAVLVIGSRLSWHEQLWAPMAAPGRRFFYNDWLWYWHRLHNGPYDYHAGHFYPDPSLALNREYLDAHGIGAVVITDIADRSTDVDARSVAAASPDLEAVTAVGAWDVYAVSNPTGLATLNGRPADDLHVSDDGETMRITFRDAQAGTVRVRQNWFPRWMWTSSDTGGDSLPAARATDGYIDIPTEGGDVEITLRYTTTSADTLARLASIGSALVAVGLIAGVRPSRRWARR